ncbi:KAP family P-loop NTPase fold protein [Xanthomonas sacchari]|uniref:KAP family P-loop NTPase fold protein n=1 Tax=Xanthomonas sacchari TaxID=56458 RepID=UPI0035281431
MAESQAWAGDLLDRKPLAEYLTKSLKAQSASLAVSERGLTVALDAEWGAGKSFFVINWRDDLRAAGHPVVYFDAWENDIGDEAAISLMAAILSELRGCLPKNQVVIEKAESLGKKSIKKLRRALMPAAGVILKGLVKKTTSIAVDELMDAISDADEEGSEDSSVKVDAVLDGLFEKALLEHESRKEELIAFKSSLTDLLNLVCKSGRSNPLFVFVDELDRCRPSYAIKLLEEIKHIFGIKNVVYVVSTNIDQLQSSVRAVYGLDFDGRGYLRRLFNREYSLPRVGGTSFANDLIIRLGWKPVKVELGLPRRSSGGKSTIADTWVIISEAFGFDYRTQEQVFSLAVEASTFVDQDAGENPLHVLWLFYLSALYYVFPSFLREIASGSVDQMRESIIKSIKKDVEIFYNLPADRFDRDAGQKSKSLSHVLLSYLELSLTPSRKVFDLGQGNSYEYPANIRNALIGEVGAYYGGSMPPFLSIKNYADLVLGSGFVMGSQVAE